jgi:hypothetical protein
VASHTDYSRLVLHHYAVKSEEEFSQKMARGDVMGDPVGKGRDFWDRIEAGWVARVPGVLLCTYECWPRRAFVNNVCLLCCRSVNNCTAGVRTLKRLGMLPANDAA